MSEIENKHSVSGKDAFSTVNNSLFLDTLPDEQRAIWAAFAEADMAAFTLYGGTALALRYGHRISVDFDFFSNHPVNPGMVARCIPWLNHQLDIVLQNDSNTYAVLAKAPHCDARDVVKLSFFGGMQLPVLEPPEVAENGVRIASVRDLLATKLKVLHDRVEYKDYVDIAEILQRSPLPPLSLQQGLSDFESMYEGANAAITLKELCWFNQPELNTLNLSTKQFLTSVVQKVADLPPATSPSPLMLRRSEDGGLISDK